MYHKRTKHIDVKLYLIRDEISKGAVVVSKIHTDVNLTDMLTKFRVNLIAIMSDSN